MLSRFNTPFVFPQSFHAKNVKASTLFWSGTVAAMQVSEKRGFSSTFFCGCIFSFGAIRVPTILSHFRCVLVPLSLLWHRLQWAFVFEFTQVYTISCQSKEPTWILLKTLKSNFNHQWDSNAKNAVTSHYNEVTSNKKIPLLSPIFAISMHSLQSAST